MGIGKIDPEYGVREGWIRDTDGEVSYDGYNALLYISTEDGTSGFSVINSTGAISFSTKSDGDGYVAKNLGIGTFNPSTNLEVVGKTKTNQFQMTDGAVDGYVLTCDKYGNAKWEDAYVAGGTGITEEEHRELDQLVHIISENSFEEVTYESGNKVTNITVWSNSDKILKIREEQYSYDSWNRVIQIITLQYDSIGNEVERMTESITYDNGNKVSTISRTVVLS